MVMMLSSHDVAGLRRLLAAAHRRGASPAKICSLLDRAISGLYYPHGRFIKRDLDIALLVKAIGGPRLLYALGKSHGLASWRTVKCHLKIPKLLPSVGIPSADEISHITLHHSLILKSSHLWNIHRMAVFQEMLSCLMV